MSTLLKDLAPGFRQKIEVLLGMMVTRGIPVIVTQTLRTELEQLALWAQGRAQLETVQALRTAAGMRLLEPRENTYTVTNCDGIVKRSAHQSGEAVDIVPRVPAGESSWNYAKLQAQYRAIVEEAHLLGLNSGADWPPIDARTGLGKDPPHHEL